jgi:hypothetical protein
MLRAALLRPPPGPRMRLRLTAAIALACTVALVPASSGGARVSAPPKGFFGVAPQTSLTSEDARYMRAGGIESVRVPLFWSEIQPTAKGGYNWGGFDQTISIAARAGLQVLPSIGTPPRWVTPKATTMPIDSARQRAAWTAFLQAAVKRYGPGGEFWREHAPEGVNYDPAITKPTPIRAWQIWNESNFFYFAYPVSPARYAKLVTISSKAIKGTKSSAKVILSGLFGRPTASGKRGMPAATFLRQFYRTPGIKSRFDGVSLHPYAVDTETLEELVEEFHEVTVENHDRPGLYITEMGWGSQNDFNRVAFEQGVQGQVRELRGAYGYLLGNRRRLNLKQVYWFSWKDLPDSCNFCDSVGFFREGRRFKPKPAWRAFVAITGGRSRP